MAAAKVTGDPGFIVEEFSVASSGYGNLTGEKFSALQGIRHFCAECQGGHFFAWRDSDGRRVPPSHKTKEVKECESTTCYLHPFRNGRNTHRVGTRKKPTAKTA